jgi:hypothetical protein
MSASFRRRTTPGRALAGLLLAVACTALAACGSPAEGPSAGETSEAPSAASPYAVKLDGPDTAGVGDEVTVTLTNVGRLPDAYRLTSEPLGAAKLDQPNLHASAGESVEVKVAIKATPVSIVVESVGGGAGPLGQLTIN